VDDRPPPYDLTPPISHELPVWPGDPRPRQRWLSRLGAGDPAGLSLSEWALGSHTGAHIDAPSHFIFGGAPVEQVPLSTLVGPCVVLDLTSAPGDVSPRDLPPDLAERVLLKTRNSLRAWPREAFRSDYVGLTPDAAAHLVERGVRLVGADYLSIESFASVEAGAPVHRLLLRGGVVILEGLVLADVPAADYQLVALPLRLRASEAAPARVVLFPFPRFSPRAAR
jgi:arylformamidase